jgi:hypothetical protein
MRSKPSGSRIFRSLGLAMGAAAIMVFLAESRNAAQQGNATR